MIQLSILIWKDNPFWFGSFMFDFILFLFIFSILVSKFCQIEYFVSALYFLCFYPYAIKCDCTFCNSQLCIMHFIRSKKIVALVFITLNQMEARSFFNFMRLTTSTWRITVNDITYRTKYLSPIIFLDKLLP